jgi:hypothetical protein
MVDTDDELMLKEQEEYGFNPHKLISEEELEFKSCNDAEILIWVCLQ